MLRSPVSRFFWGVVLWLPLSFAGWYYMAIVMTWPVTYLTDLVMTGLFPNAVTDVVQQGYMLDVATAFAPPGAVQAPGRIAEMVFSVNPLIYGYSIPLFTGLMLATPGEEGDKWFRWTIGILVLIPVQVWGVSFEILKTLLFNLGPDVREAMGFAPWQLEAVALGYQAGYLVLPAVTPIVVWIAFHREFLARLAPGVAERFASRS